jgi:hypothetical protein
MKGFQTPDSKEETGKPSQNQAFDILVFSSFLISGP